MRKSSDLASSAQCLAFYQDMSSLLFQAKDRALYGFFAFTLEILCLTCSECQKGPDHKKKKNVNAFTRKVSRHLHVTLPRDTGV